MSLSHYFSCVTWGNPYIKGESNVRSGVWRGKEKINFRISKLNTELHNQRPVNEFFIILLLVVFGCAGSPLLGGLSLVEHMEATRSLSRCVRGLLAAAASLLWSTGSRARLTSCGSWASLLCGVWGSKEVDRTERLSNNNHTVALGEEKKQHGVGSYCLNLYLQKHKT